MEGINKCKREMARDKHNDRYGTVLQLRQSRYMCRCSLRLSVKGMKGKNVTRSRLKLQFFESLSGKISSDPELVPLPSVVIRMIFGNSC
jgi:hypothetical protein